MNFRTTWNYTQLGVAVCIISHDLLALMFSGSKDFFLPGILTSRGRSRLLMPSEKNSCHSVHSSGGSCSTTPAGGAVKNSPSRTISSHVSHANSCTQGFQKAVVFSLAVWWERESPRQGNDHLSTDTFNLHPSTRGPNCSTPGNDCKWITVFQLVRWRLWLLKYHVTTR